MSATPERTVRRVSPRLPLPDSVYLFNGFYDKHLLAHSASGKPNTTLFHYLRNHSSSLLRQVRLELIVQEPEFTREDDTKPRWREHRLYAQTLSSGTIQPVWHHLRESIDISELSVDSYESMTLRFFTRSIVEEVEAEEAKDTDTLWQQVAVHPSQLVRLGEMPQPAHQSLPMNFIVIEYTDKSLRTTPALYQLLESKSRKTDIAKLVAKREGGAIDDEEFGRFKENAFSALDQVTAIHEKQLVVDESDLLLPMIDKTSPMKKTREHSVEREPVSANVHQSSVEQKKNQISILEAEIRAQEQALVIEMQELEAENLFLEKVQKKLLTKDQQTAEVVQAIQQEKERGAERTIKLQAQQVRLVRELRQIYPIGVKMGTGESRRFSVRDLDFPATMSEILMAPEDHVSAVLGYTCHLVHMLSKYLAVQLRYRLLCHNSRSGIQDDKAVVHPLFQGRRIEREQLEHGILLLQRNVDCLCLERDVGVSPKLHILGKVKRIYEHVIDGY